jgi:hypothetical protein
MRRREFVVLLGSATAAGQATTLHRVLAAWPRPESGSLRRRWNNQTFLIGESTLQ